VNDQVGPEPALLATISTWRQKLGKASMPIVLEVDGEICLEFIVQVVFEVNTEAMHKSKLVRLKIQQYLIVGGDIAECV
jgi:hypothetical protein